MLSHSPSLYFPQWPTVAHICYYLHSLAIILGVQCPNSSVIDTGLKVLSSWFALQASNIQQQLQQLLIAKPNDFNGKDSKLFSQQCTIYSDSKNCFNVWSI